MRGKARQLDGAEEAEQRRMRMQLTVRLEQLLQSPPQEAPVTRTQRGKGTARAPVAVCAKGSDAQAPPMTLPPAVVEVRLHRSPHGSD